MTPDAAETVSLSATATENRRTYTATVPAGTTGISIALVQPAQVTVTDGTVTFTRGTPTATTATLAAADAVEIISVNGVTLGAAAAQVDDVAALGTSVTFTVAYTDATSFLPVVWQDNLPTAAGDNNLQLGATAAPTEAFGIGGQLNVIPAEAVAGGPTAQTVTTANVAAGYFVSASGTFFLNDNDTYQLNGVAITRAQFEGLLGLADVVTTTYVTGAAGADTFNMTTDNLNIPSIASLVASGTTATLTITPGTQTSSGTQFVIQRAPVTAGADGVLGTGDDVIGTFATVATTSATTFTDAGLANGGYRYQIRATNPVSGVTTAFTAASGTIVIPGTGAAAGAPTSSLTTLTANPTAVTVLNAGDEFKVVFNTAIRAPQAGNQIHFDRGTDPAGAYVNGTNATFTVNAAAETVAGVSYPAGRVLTVAVTDVPRQAGTLATELANPTFPVALTASIGIVNAANTDAGWDFGNSFDVTITAN